MPESKVLRVVGLASSVPMDEKDPSSAINRRIAIVVMNKKAEDAVRAMAKTERLYNNPDDKPPVDLPPVPKINGLPFQKNG
jgi:chemotaxis protein MotB